MNKFMMTIGLWADRHRVGIDRAHLLMCCMVAFIFGLFSDLRDPLLDIARWLVLNTILTIPWILLTKVRHRAIYGRWP